MRPVLVIVNPSADRTTEMRLGPDRVRPDVDGEGRLLRSLRSGSAARTAQDGGRRQQDDEGTGTMKHAHHFTITP